MFKQQTNGVGASKVDGQDLGLFVSWRSMIDSNDGPPSVRLAWSGKIKIRFSIHFVSAASFASSLHVRG
jgi:hypothetical protein